MCHRLHLLGVLFLAGAIVLPVLADDDKDAKPETTKPSGDVPSGKAPSTEKWSTVWDVVGTITKVNAGSLSLKVEYLDQAAAAANQQQVMQQLMRYQQQALRAAMSRGRSGSHHHSLARVQPTRSNGANQKSAVTTKEVDLTLAEEVRVRVGSPQAEFDDKGNLKHYSPEEMKTLKGGDKTWGYLADVSALKPGEVVRVIVAHKKSLGPKPKDAPPDDTQPVVRIIMVLKDPIAQASADKTKKK